MKFEAFKILKQHIILQTNNINSSADSSIHTG